MRGQSPLKATVDAAPVGPVITVDYDVVDGLPREIEDDEEQLVDPFVLRASDRDGDAYRVSRYSIARMRSRTSSRSASSAVVT